MRVEADDPERAPQGLCGLGGLGDDLLVAAMDPVNAAVGDGRALLLGRFQTLPTVNDPHRLGRPSDRGGGDHDDRLAVHHGLAVHLAEGGERDVRGAALSRAWTVTRVTTGSPIFTGRRKRRDLVEIDRARPGQLGAEHRRDVGAPTACRGRSGPGRAWSGRRLRPGAVGVARNRGEKASTSAAPTIFMVSADWPMLKSSKKKPCTRDLLLTA